MPTRSSFAAKRAARRGRKIHALGRRPSASHSNGVTALLAAAAAQQEQDADAADRALGPPAGVSAAADAAAAARPSLGDAAADAAAGLSAASLIDATASAAAGIGPDEDLVGAAAEACLRDGSANGVGYTWCFTSGGLVAYRFGLTRAGMMHKCMEGFKDNLVSDRYPVYRSRYEIEGRLQLCWAHELRDLAEIAMRPGSSLASRRLYRDVRAVYRTARDAADSDTPRTKALRLMYEHTLDDVLDMYRGCEEEDVGKLVAMLDRDKRCCSRS